MNGQYVSYETFWALVRIVLKSVYLKNSKKKLYTITMNQYILRFTKSKIFNESVLLASHKILIKHANITIDK